MTDAFPIAHVEQVTGIPRALLRMWERRYGYPLPARDTQGDRIYTANDIAKLALICQLMAHGHRPGKLVKLDISCLQRLNTDVMTRESRKRGELVSVLKSGNIHSLHDWLESRLHSQGLRNFICETLPHLNRDIGDGWEQGDISIHEEHFYTEQIKNLLRGAFSSLPLSNVDAPKILLTTIPGEQHGLGLLMVEGLLRLEACTVVSLCTETPVDNILAAVQVHRPQVLALSFSIAFPAERAWAELQGLRLKLPADTALWAGGMGLGNQHNFPNGTLARVKIMRNLHELHEAVLSLKQ